MYANIFPQIFDPIHAKVYKHDLLHGLSVDFGEKMNSTSISSKLDNSKNEESYLKRLSLFWDTVRFRQIPYKSLEGGTGPMRVQFQ